MRQRWFMKAQIIDILKEHQAGLSADELCKKHGISDTTFCKWRSKLVGMEVVDAKRMRALKELSYERWRCGRVSTTQSIYCMM